MTVTTGVRRRVYERDGGVCVVARPDCVSGLTIQHRANRQAGGSDLRDGFENLITMCSHHNTLLETDAAFAALGRRLGWKLESWENPFQVGVFSRTWGGWRVLDALGGFVDVTARDEEQRLAMSADRYAGWRS